MTSVLELDDLSVVYRSGQRRAQALRGVSLRVDPGEVLGIAGESGCGKSTLALAVLRLLPPYADIRGRVLLDGEDVFAMSWGRLRAVRWSHTAIVFQGGAHTLNPLQRVGTQVAEPLVLHQRLRRGPARRRAAELLEQVGLPARQAGTYPHELSGGQRQRVMIAMALACGPRLLIADEASSALDAVVESQVLSLLLRLAAERRIAMLLISHDLRLLGAACHQVAVMYAGEVVEHGPAAALLELPRHPYTAALVAASPRLGDPAARYHPRGLGGEPPDPTRLPAGCAFHPRCPNAVPTCAQAVVELVADGPARRNACVRRDLVTAARSGTIR